jgi:hypothetical protein
MHQLAVWNDWQSALIAIAVVSACYLAVMWITAVAWTWRDVGGRTTDGFERVASVLLVVAFAIPGLLLYVLMRPRSTIEERMERRLEAEAMFQDIQERPACPQCAARVQPDFVFCPVCRAQLRFPCGVCGEALANDWVMCPYCTSDRARPGAATRGRTASRKSHVKQGATRPAFATGRPRA